MNEYDQENDVLFTHGGSQRGLHLTEFDATGKLIQYEVIDTNFYGRPADEVTPFLDSLQVGNFLAVAVSDTYRANEYTYVDVKVSFEGLGANGEYFPADKEAWLFFTQVNNVQNFHT